MSRLSILFPYRGDDGHRDVLFGWVLRWWQLHFPDAEIVVGRNFDRPFHRGRARNEAFDLSTGQVLIVADADTIPTASGVRSAIADVIEAQCWVIPYAEHRYYNLSEDATKAILACSACALPEPTDPQAYEHKITSWAGCLVLPREAWETVGGYDDRFFGWGGEDNAFRLALDRLWGPHRRSDSHVCHLWHPRGDADFSQPHWPQNQRLLRLYQAANSVEEMQHVRFG